MKEGNYDKIHIIIKALNRVPLVEEEIPL